MIRRPPAPRHVKGRMNGTEHEFYRLFIQPRILTGEAVKCEFETLKLKLAKNCFYTPDFLVEMKGGQLLVYEIKGGRIWDGAREKFLWSSEKYGHEYEFHAWQKKAGQWKEIWK